LFYDENMIDLRSDLMSGPPPGMEQALREALTAAPAFGHREDPYQVRLEATVAQMMGFEDALLVPTCTVANQIALRLWKEELGSGQVLADRLSHLVTAEQQVTSVLNSVSMSVLDGQGGHLCATQIEDHLQTGAARPLIWLENTHMAHGGTVMPIDWMVQIATAARAHGARIHLDGSRIWNAAVRLGVPPAKITRGADSLSLSLTKGLGAPAGSMLLGSREFIRRAVDIRSAFGAAWRPIGLISAAGLHVLQGYKARLEQDHLTTLALATSIKHLCEESDRGFDVNMPDTNILMLRAPDSSAADRLFGFFKSREILCLRLGSDRVRMVVHARIREPEVGHTVTALAQFMSQPRQDDASR
jgi:threonine aldolase